ncbi:glycosyltransferase [Microvirga terrae]|uniref:Glycosyltransferase n=1 Tax=Microvirga terrae TaxID=2740529 RepID=A0ABY5RMF3_9HYPH|nr:glycosyltransferase family 2 protein [Microvirga terrae]UVF18410.1 glycosyltransferase [Microvirga terrae]
MHPRVSIIIPTYNAAAHIGRALQSARLQTIEDIEIIVIDDGSSDATAEIVARVADADCRVLYIARRQNGGPSAARNDGIEKASGEWIAVLDADDEMASNRLERLLELGGATSADIVADNIIVSPEAHYAKGHHRKGRPALPSSGLPYHFSVDAVEYIRRNMMLTSGFKLGYLKPMFRRDMLRASGLFYDTDVRIGEDYLLCLQALLTGARFVVTSEALYRYWVNPGSLSSKLTKRDILALQKAQHSVVALCTNEPLRRQLAAYDRHLIELLMYTDFVETLKHGRLHQAAASALLRPRLWRHIIRGGSEAITKRARRIFLV